MAEFVAQLASINPLKDLLVPALAALVGLWLATRKFRNERLWQEKYAAYQRVFASIEAIRYWGDEISADVHMLPCIGWFDGKKSKDFYAEAKREVAKQCQIGTLLLAPDFVDMLAKFQTELFNRAHQASVDFQPNEQDEEFAFGAHAAEIRDLADGYLPNLIELARNDLGA
jgi:hypothetical protein